MWRELVFFSVMGQDMRKLFIGSILVGLIEKSPDVKVMKAITKMLEDWMKNKDVKMLNQGPNLKEKSILLVKLMQYVEKRFPDDAELNGQFLDLINYVYRDELLRNRSGYIKGNCFILLYPNRKNQLCTKPSSDFLFLSRVVEKTKNQAENFSRKLRL